MPMRSSSFYVAPPYQPLMREIGLDADAVFDHPDIKVWRSIPERENATLDAAFQGRPIRLHIKRFRGLGADDETDGIQLLLAAGIPTVPLVGWGHLADGRSFVISEDLQGYEAADKLIERGMPFGDIIEPTADISAKLHSAKLHHRDLYLCHFFMKSDDPRDARLIDAARVAKLTNPLTRQRWIKKDLAQFWYSTLSLPVTDEQRRAWMSRYSQQRGLPSPEPLIEGIQRKVQWIARHDVKLRADQPTRNVSIPR
jgi:hypothetical protein